MQARVFVTGIGCVLPGAVGRAGLTALAAAPGCLLAPEFIGREVLVARVADPDPEGRVPARRKRRMNRIGVMATAAALDALGDAGRTPGDLPETAGIVLGTGLGATDSTSRFFTEVLTEGPGMADPSLFPTGVPNAIASQVAMVLGLRGPNLTVSQQELSGEVALIVAADLVAAGRSPLVLVGGADEVTLQLVEVLEGEGLLAPPGAPSIPMDPESRGVGVGEGATFLVLEGEGGADRAIAEVLATALHGVPAPPARYDESGEALATAIREVLDGPPGAVFLGSNGHPAGDRAHARALAALPPPAPPVTTVKSMFGEGLSTGLAQAALAGELVDLGTGTFPSPVDLGTGTFPSPGGWESGTKSPPGGVLVASTAIGGAAAAIRVGAPC